MPARQLTRVFFNDTATTEIYTLSLHDALPISILVVQALGLSTQADLRQARADVGDRIRPAVDHRGADSLARVAALRRRDRKSTRLNSSHANIPYAAFCLKKKIEANVEQSDHYG